MQRHLLTWFERISNVFNVSSTSSDGIRRIKTTNHYLKGPKKEQSFAYNGPSFTVNTNKGPYRDYRDIVPYLAKYRDYRGSAFECRDSHSPHLKRCIYRGFSLP